MRRRVRLERPANCNFSERAATRAVQFFQQELRHTKGQFAGKPFLPTPDQELDLREIFGRVDSKGNRIIRQVFKMVPKKNGKSEEAAGVALKLLFADNEPSAEILGAASDLTQSMIVFSVAASMVRHNPTLIARSKIFDSTKSIVVPGTESYYRAMTSKVAGKHGFNSSGVIFDELHAQANMDLWDVLTFGAGAARSQPLTYAITTAGVRGESPVAEMLYDEADQILRGLTPCPDHLYVVLYGADDDDDWTSEEVWRSCNPFIDLGLMPIEVVRQECQDAQRRPQLQNTFRRLRLNQWVAQDVRAIDMSDWDQCSKIVDLKEAKFLTWCAGMDLSMRVDMTALVLVARTGTGTLLVIPWFWAPRQNIEDKPNIASAKYIAWAKQGLLTLTDGNSVDYTAVRSKLKELRASGLKIREVGFDPWNSTHLAEELTSDGFKMVEVRQGYPTLSEPTKELLAAILDHNVNHGGHPILRWCADCLAIRQDENANIRPVKPDRRKTTKRIDGIVATIIAMSRLPIKPRESIYATRGLLTIPPTLIN
jgi:phage terminase large subunit-like protein